MQAINSINSQRFGNMWKYYCRLFEEKTISVPVAKTARYGRLVDWVWFLYFLYSLEHNEAFDLSLVSFHLSVPPNAYVIQTYSIITDLHFYYLLILPDQCLIPNRINAFQIKVFTIAFLFDMMGRPAGRHWDGWTDRQTGQQIGLRQTGGKSCINSIGQVQ